MRCLPAIWLSRAQNSDSLSSIASAKLEAFGCEILSGLAIAPGEPAAERSDYKQVFLFDRLQTKLEDLNPKIPPEGFQEALRKLRLERMKRKTYEPVREFERQTSYCSHKAAPRCRPLYLAGKQMLKAKG